jgi:hypothetical protein
MASGNFRRLWWVPQNGQRKGKDSVVVEIQGPQAMPARKGLIPISASCASIPDKAKARDLENGIIHHSPRETLKKRHHLPIKRNKQLAFDGMGIKEAVNV